MADTVVAVVQAPAIKALFGQEAILCIPGKAVVGSVFVGEARQAAKAVVCVLQAVAQGVDACKRVAVGVELVAGVLPQRVLVRNQAACRVVGKALLAALYF